MSRPLVLFAVLSLSLAACQQSAQEPAAALPDPADTSTADAQPAAANPSTNALPLKKPSATDVPMPGTAAAPAATVGAAGYGALRFGMTRDQAEHAAGAVFNGPTQGSACEPLYSPAQPGVTYLFEGDKLQRIIVHTPDVMADGGGHVGMRIDDIRTLYAGKLHEQQLKNGYDLKDLGKNGDGIVFETDAGGKVVSFRAGIASALDGPEGCR